MEMVDKNDECVLNLPAFVNELVGGFSCGMEAYYRARLYDGDESVIRLVKDVYNLYIRSNENVYDKRLICDIDEDGDVVMALHDGITAKVLDRCYVGRDVILNGVHIENGDGDSDVACRYMLYSLDFYGGGIVDGGEYKNISDGFIMFDSDGRFIRFLVFVLPYVIKDVIRRPWYGKYREMYDGFISSFVGGKQERVKIDYIDAMNVV